MGNGTCSSFWISLTTDLYFTPVAEHFMLMVATIVARNIVAAAVVVVVVVVPTIVAPVTVRVQVTWVACATHMAPVCAAIHGANTTLISSPHH